MPQLEQLVGLGGRVLGQVLQIIPNAQVRPIPSLDLSNPEVHVEPHWDQIADLGLSAASIGYAVDAFVDGAYAADYYIGGDKIDLTLVGREDLASRIQDIRELPVATPMGELVPLGSIADIRLSSGPEQINHRETQRTITIEVSPPPAVALEDAMDSIRSKIVEPLTHDPAAAGVRINLAGTADKLQATWKALRFNVILALLITYLLMAALFESWIYPFIVIVSVPLAAVGGIAGLWLLNRFVLQPLDVLTMLGFVILIGTVGQQRDPDRPPGAQQHARARHGTRRGAARQRAHAHPTDLHDDDHDGVRPDPARRVAGRRQRALPRPRQRRARRPGRVDGVHAAAGADAVPPAPPGDRAFTGQGRLTP